MRIRVATTLALALVITALWASPAAAETANVCGTMSQYRAPTQTVAGTITVGSETYAIATNARSNISPQATVGSRVCLTGTWNMSQTVGRELSDLTVVPQTQTASSVPPAAGSPATLPATESTEQEARPNYGVLVLAGLAVIGALLAVMRLRQS